MCLCNRALQIDIYLLTYLLTLFMLQAFVGYWGVDAGAVLTLQMLRYANPGGKDYLGFCCETLSTAFCRDQCDHIFRFALDRANRYI